MTDRKGKPEPVDVKELLERDEDFLRAALQALVEAALKAEMIETIGAAKGERSATRLAYRSGYYGRSLITGSGYCRFAEWRLDEAIPYLIIGESRTSWRDFLSGLKERGLFGVEFVVSDDHGGLRQAIHEVLPGAAW